MKAKDFKALLKSIDEARAIRVGKRKPGRVTRHRIMGGKRINALLAGCVGAFSE